ncbi:MAG TPA: metallophosphoesterase [Solirubrobacterales bacterium]|nr:metallophosphoesterase [Solirubrobacterales bacterium]
MGLFGNKGGKSKADRKRLLFATDLHGSEYTFAKLLKVLDLWSPDALILGGDVAGKGLLPVLVTGGRARIRWMGEEHDVPLEEIEQYEARANQLGFYPYRVDTEGLERLRVDEEFKDRVFEDLMMERWSQWLDRLEERCAELELPAYVIAGNDDPWALDELNALERTWVKGADGAVLPLLDDWTLLSIGLANETPWQCPRDVSEERLAEELAALADQVEDFGRVVANIHVPPYGSSLDIAPELDTSFEPPKPITGSTVPVGSKAVTEFLMERQPLLSLHGHIHESPGKVDIGKTYAINPGSEFAEGILRAVLVTVEPERVVGHQFVSG